MYKITIFRKFSLVGNHVPFEIIEIIYLKIYIYLANTERLIVKKITQNGFVT